MSDSMVCSRNSSRSTLSHNYLIELRRLLIACMGSVDILAAMIEEAKVDYH